MERKVEWFVRPVTHFELVRSYQDSDGQGRTGGGSALIGTYDTEDQARQAMRVFKDAEDAEQESDGNVR